MTETKALAPPAHSVVIQNTERTDQAKRVLYAALVRAQKAAQAVAKESKNSFHGYKYASAEAIIEEARGALSSAGLALFPMGWAVIQENGMTSVRVQYRLVHESGDELNFDTTQTAVIPEKGRPEDKAEATALTYNLGYFLRGLLLLPREEPDTSPDKRDDRAYQPSKNHAHPPEGSEALAEELKRAMLSARDYGAAEKVASGIALARQANKITSEQAVALRPVYLEKLKEFKSGAAA